MRFVRCDSNPAAANPSAAFTSGTNQLDPSGNYLGALSPADQAAFQAGSFDVFLRIRQPSATCRPTTRGAGSSTVDVNYPNTINGVEYLNHFLITTSNNLGVNAGTAYESSTAWAGNSYTQVVFFTPDPHTITNGYSGSNTDPLQTLQSLGYLSPVLLTASTNTYGQFYGTVAGINDHNILALTEYQYVIATRRSKSLTSKALRPIIRRAASASAVSEAPMAPPTP